MFNFLRNVFRRKKVTPIRRHYAARPRLELLEDRCAPAVLTVNSLADTTAAGSALTLREAIMLVDGTLGRSLTTAEQAQVTGTLGSNDTIQFNLPSGAQTITLTGGLLSITNPVTIDGPGANLLTINGNNTTSDFYVGSSFSQNLNLSVSMSGLTIADGNAQYGAGLFNSGTLALANVAFNNNTATNNGGGGIYNDGNLTLNNCSFSNNTTNAGNDGSTDGGGLLNLGNGTVTINNCSFTGNAAPGTGSLAGSGGGLSNDGTMTITSSTFNANTCGSDGGAIYNDGIMTIANTTLSNNNGGADGGAIRAGLYDGYSTLTMTGCTVSGNVSSSEGGGVDCTWSALVTITNSTFYGNTTGSQGGAIRYDGSQLFLTNDTITGNRVNTPSTTVGGGGILVQNTITLDNTIVAGNFGGSAPSTTPNDIFGTVASASAYNLIGTGGAGGLTNGTNGNQVGVTNLALSGLANNGGPTQTVALLPGSPAIAAGSTAYVTAGETDQRGDSRTVNGMVDIGAYELQATTMSSTAPSNQTASQGVAGTFNLGSFSDSNASGSPWTVSVNWNDGSAASTFTTTAQGSLGSVTHTFQASGTLSVVVSVTDSAGSSSQASFQVAVAAAPAVLLVNSTADSTAAGSALTLREAVEIVDGTLGRALTAAEQAQITGALGANDTIEFNLPAGAQTITLTGGALDLTAPVTISGPGAGNLTINGDALDRVFVIGTLNSQKLSLVDSISGLTITNGKATYGAGVINFSTVNINNCVISNNVAGTSGGGGIYNAGALNLSNTTITGNSCGQKTDGGGIYNITAGTATITNCTFTNNSATGTGSNGSEGGGIFTSGTLTVSNSTFTGNSAGSDAGALFTDGTTTATFCTFTNNTTGADGGALHATGTFTVSCCLVANNTAASSGGGMEEGGGGTKLTIINTTFANNTASGTAGGFVNWTAGTVLTNDTFTGNRATNGASGTYGGGIWAPDSLTLQNTIVAGNFAGSGTTENDIAGTVASSSSYNLIGTGAGGLANGTNHNQIGAVNFGLGTLANNGGPTQTIALLAGSPAIAAGSTAFVSAGETDQRGFTRIVNGAVDIGAYEVQTASAASFTVTGVPSSIQAGASATITVTALFASGSVATNYTGTVHFTSSDLQAVLPANYTFVAGNNGVATFTVTLKTAGSQTVTVTDTAIGITGAQAGITVTPAAASSFTVAGFPNPTTAGVAGSFTVTAHDAFGNVATGYLGTIHFTSTDAQAVLSANYTFVAADNGLHTFSATLKTAGSQSITATDTTSGITGVHAAITVNPAAASTLTVAGFPSPTLAGAAGSFTVTAHDAFGNTATGYLGTIHFTSTDSAAVLPANYTFVAADVGVHTFSATFKTAGTQTITAADTKTATITGTHANITVNPAAFSTLRVVGFPSPTTAGVAGAFTVTAVDSLGNVLTNYTGTISFTSTDPHAVLPASYTFGAADAGVHTFTATLQTAGSQTITATDASAGVIGTHSAITVTPAAASVLAVAGFPNPTQVGVAGSFTVTALDAFGNTATGYLGTVHFTSSDAAAKLPANYTFVAADKGVHTFSATFGTVGTQTITAADTKTATITGTHSPITVNPSGAILIVNSTADNTTADNVLTLREAIEVVDGTLGRSLTTAEQAQITGTIGKTNTIEFNLPAGPQTITLTGGPLDLTTAASIVGPGAANLTISGNNASRVLIIGVNYSQNLSLNVSISGLTISGGIANTGGQNYGGGLLNFGTLTLNNDAFTNNSAGNSGGGAIYNDAVITVSNSSFTGNSVVSGGVGGGIQNDSEGTVTVSNCSFTNNTGTGGSQGAAIANSGVLTITGSNFTGNSADSDAGAIYNPGQLTVSTTTFANNSSGADGGAIRSEDSLTISACTFSGNTAASDGGGLDMSDSNATIINSTFYDNTAVSEGGGIFADTGAATITNCTITDNFVQSSGAGGGGLIAFGSVTLDNTIIAANFRGTSTPDDIAGTVTSASAYNLIGTGGAGGLTNGANGNQVGVANPGLGTLANNGGPTLTVALLAGSSAIDAGSNSFVVAGETDQTGNPRIFNGTVDIGAFEVQ